MNDVEKAAKRIGQLVAEKYRLRRVLGVGGMGAVYAAVHAFTSKHVAVKLLDPAVSDSEGYAARFLREARAASAIGHPAIVDVLDAGQLPDNSLYLVLELLEGEDLSAAIKRGDLQEGEVVDIGVQLLDALAAAHDRGIIHRDVKPENVFLTRDEHGNLRVKLLDFGVAKTTRGEDLYSTREGSLVGTPYYMSPEQAAGDPVDARSDVWSVGAVLYHAFAGRPPYDAPNYNKLIIKLLAGPPAPLRSTKPEVPDWIARVVDAALRPDRKERWQSARQMQQALVKKEMPIGLDWEESEDHTTRSVSPFEDGADSLAPPAIGPSHVTPNVIVAPKPAPVPREMVATMAAQPRARVPTPPPQPVPMHTPQSWQKPDTATPRIRAPEERSRGALMGAIIGGVAAIVVLGLLGVLLLGGDETPVYVAPPRRPTPLVIPLAVDAGIVAQPPVPAPGL